LTCILIPSHERYRGLAGFTAGQISRQWANHPPVFFCGLSGLPRENGVLLLRDRDSADWIGILTDAVREVKKRGFKLAYLILDDHPPMGPCRSDILNDVLPTISLSWNAEIVSLLGSGQGRRTEGRIFRQGMIGLEQLPRAYLWRYSLHPGLWSLHALEKLLTKLESGAATMDARTPWAFERIGARKESQSDGNAVTQCYRVASPVITASVRDQSVGALFRALGMGARSVAGILGGPGAWTRVSQRFDFAHNYYGGPYPMVWQGVMAKGLLNKDFQQFCRYFRKTDLLDAVSTLRIDEIS